MSRFQLPRIQQVRLWSSLEIPAAAPRLSATIAIDLSTRYVQIELSLCSVLFMCRRRERRKHPNLGVFDVGGEIVLTPEAPFHLP